MNDVEALQIELEIMRRLFKAGADCRCGNFSEDDVRDAVKQTLIDAVKRSN